MGATKQDVLLALLSLDAYNRGTDTKLAGVDGSEFFVHIGTTLNELDSYEISGSTEVDWGPPAISALTELLLLLIAEKILISARPVQYLNY